MTKKECDERVKRVRARWAERLKDKNIEIRKWKRKYKDCMEGGSGSPHPPPAPPEPKPDKPILSLETDNGRFYVNGKATKLYGVSKREMIAVGSGDYSQSKVNYTYPEIKKAILNSNINYIRVLAGNSLMFFRDEVKDFLKHGINVEVELFDAGKPYRAWQAYWKDTFDCVKDLPIFFDAHNEFLEKDVVSTVVDIVRYVAQRSCIVSAGAWSGVKGKKLAEEFKKRCNAYQVVSHHRNWTNRSLQDSVEFGKPIIMNEIHTRSKALQQIKDLFKSAFSWGCDAVNVYSLLNWGMGKGSNFQKTLDYVSEFRKNKA